MTNQDGGSFQVVTSEDGKTWAHVLDDSQSFWCIREARERSEKDRNRYFRVLAHHVGGVALITLRGGQPVYDVP